MRWPTGLSGFARLETGSIPSPPPTPICDCKDCSSNDRNQDVPALWSRNDEGTAATEIALGEAPLVQQDLHGCGEGAEGSGLPAVRNDVSSEGQSQARDTLLLAEMRECGATDQGTVSEGAGRREGSLGPSGDEGARTGSSSDFERDRAPCRSRQVEQRSGQSGNHDDAGTLAPSHAGQPTCATFLKWWNLQSSYVSMLFSALPHDTQMEMFAERLSA